LFFSGDPVEKSEIFRPDPIEDHATCCRLEHFDIRVSKDRLPAYIRILESDLFVDFYRSFCECKLDFLQFGE